jgi:hypothetical protein
VVLTNRLISCIFKKENMATNEIMQKIASLGLYDEIDLDEKVNTVIYAYLANEHYNDLSIDLYCPFCGVMSTFNPSFENQLIKRNDIENSLTKEFEYKRMNFLVLHFRCARDKKHYFCVLLLPKDGKLIKIGQYPPRATIDAPELNRFKKILPEEKLSDMKRAVGLFSHGIGAGSFVYLRRVFEHLIYEAKEVAEKESRLNIETFERSRISEKIEMLKDFLPNFMTKNKVAYGILSKGVHELSEDECMNSFNLLEKTIELILSEKLEEKEKRDMEEAITKDLSKLSTGLANGS